MSFVKYNGRVIIRGWPATIVSGLVIGGGIIAPWAIGWVTICLHAPRLIERIGGLFG